MKERRKHKCGSRKDKGMKHSYVERLAALMLCAALLVSNAVISRADDEAEVPQMVETVNEERNADAGMQTEEPGVDGEDSQKESPSKENNGTGDQEQSQIPGTGSAADADKSQNLSGDAENTGTDGTQNSKEHMPTIGENGDTDNNGSETTGEENGKANENGDGKVPDENGEEPGADKDRKALTEEALEETEKTSWQYEDDQVEISVQVDEAGIIPAGAVLSVTPVERREFSDAMTDEERAQIESGNAQYDATAEKLQEKAWEEEKDLLGFLAYDIKFVDEDGNKIEPDGNVTVSMNYKEAVIPEEVKAAQEAGTKNADVTLFHLKEDESGQVSEIVDMIADENETASLKTTDAAEVERAEFVTDSFSQFVVAYLAERAAGGLVDLNGKSISDADFETLKKNADKLNNTTQNDDHTEANIGITWKRSKNVIKNKEKHTLSTNLGWNMDTTMSRFGEDWETDQSKVWDGSRSGDHNYTDNNYLKQNEITAQDGTLYDSATWTLNRVGDYDDFYLFRGTFDLGSMQLAAGKDYGDYNFTIQSVVPDTNIYINDNLFVFVYPSDVTLSEANCRQYLAFWTGTSNQKKNGLQAFKGIDGTVATQDSIAGYRKVTNGWYAEPVKDAAGGIIQDALQNNHSKTFYMDVIANDFSVGGGMYRLKLNAKLDTSKVKFQLHKVDSVDTNIGIKNAKFYFASTEGKGNYWLTSDDNGYISATIQPGEYILKETAPGKNYMATQNEWTVVADTSGIHITQRTLKDSNSALGGSEGSWYITNVKRTDVQPPLSAPEHKKTILKKGKDDYTLSLDVKGAVGATDPIDILLIVDESSSMNKARRENVNNAISTLVKELKKTEAKDNIQLAVIGFSGQKGDGKNNDATVCRSWTALNSFEAYTTTVNKYGGTNWQAGIRKGEEILAARTTDRSNANTYVVFLTDGNPTFYYDSWGNTQGYGSQYDETGYNNAVNEWQSSSYMLSAVKYVVDATDPNSTNKCADLATAVGAAELDGSNGTAMSTAFEQIAKDITKPRYTNVVITDTLSAYADFQDSPNVHVYTVDKNGTKTELASSQYSYTITGKTIRVSLLKGAALQEDVTYQVTFDVMPTLKAYQEYEEKGGNDAGYGGTKGDLNTDTYPDRQITSSDQPGFRSNDTASVSYEVNNESDSADYLHPVLQVEPETTTHTAVKKWVGAEGTSVDVELEARYLYTYTKEDGTKAEESRLISPKDYKALPQGNAAKATLKADQSDPEKNWKYTWENLPKYYYYEKIGEDGTIERTEIQYSVKETTTLENYETTVTVSEDGLTTTITNTEKTRWQIVKQSSNKAEDGSSITIPNAEFTLTGTDTAENEHTYTGVSGADGVIRWTEKVGESETSVDAIPQGVYTLKETKAPDDYLLNDVQWTIDTSKGGEPVVTIVGGNKISGTASTDDKTKIITYTFVFENTPNYELPSTGGIGTFWYTIGGVLLMMAAALMLYRDKSYIK